jgi:hypothetical protein
MLMNTPLEKRRLSGIDRKKEVRSSYSWPPLPQEKLFLSKDKGLIWKKYCGFLHLTLDEFDSMQRLLLMEQIELTMSSKLGLSIVGDRKPKNVNEFRKIVPLTRYEDYREFLDKKDDSALSVKPSIWTHSSARTGPAKWVPCSMSTLNSLANDTIAALILSSANKKGDVFLDAGDKIAIDFPSTEISEIVRKLLYQRLIYRSVPPMEEMEGMVFNQRINKTLLHALDSGIDFISSLPVILAKISDDLGDLSGEFKSYIQWHPLAAVRFMRALTKSKIKKQPVLPKDLWTLKGLISGGTDSSFYREKIYQSWGVNPLDIYLSTETGFMAMQGWNKKGMTLLPYSQFFEFIPEKELIKSENDREYRPSTLLLNELERNAVYELVVTNFHGGPFLRYRIGDMIKVVSTNDDEMGVNLPQIRFFNRADSAYERNDQNRQAI